MIDKPWGHEEIWARTDRYVGKILCITAGHRLSLQHHERKYETIRILEGEMELEIEDNKGVMQTIRMKRGMTAHIAPYQKHRMAVVTDVNCGSIHP